MSNRVSSLHKGPNLPIPKGIDPDEGARPASRLNSHSMRQRGSGHIKFLSSRDDENSTRDQVVYSTLIPIPDQRGNDRAQQQGPDDRTPRSDPTSRDGDNTHPEHEVPDTAAHDREKHNLAEREHAESRERVVVKNATDTMTLSAQSRTSAPILRPGRAIDRGPDSGSPSRSPGQRCSAGEGAELAVGTIRS